MTVAETPIADAAVIAERIAHLNYRAKRCMPVVERRTTDPKTPWSVLHEQLGEALAEWEAAQ